MYSRHARRFAPVAAAAPALLYGSASDTSAHLSSRIGSKLYRSAVRSMTTESSSKTAQQASTVVVPKTPPNKTFLAWYETHLQASPVQTKMFTGSFLWGLGDFVAQAMAGIEQYDYQRTGRAVFFGFAIHAPASHLHFNFLEWMTVRSGMTGLNIPIFKTVMEQFVYWSWFSNSMYHGAMGAMQGQSPTQVYKHIEDVLWETQKAQWVFWIPIQLLNFRFVPVRHQLNVVLVTSVVWTALLSMWYPPVKEDKKEEETKTLSAE